MLVGALDNYDPHVDFSTVWWQMDKRPIGKREPLQKIELRKDY